MKQLQARLAPVFAGEPAVAAAYVFGSVARGEAGPDSDLDIGVVYESDHAAKHDALATRLAAQISRATGVERVDLVDLEEQGPIFCHQVLSSGFRIHEASRARRIDFESETIVRAIDFRPTHDLATQTKPAALRRWLRNRYDLRPSPIEARPSESKPRETG
jgi:uncharacterized protein